MERKSQKVAGEPLLLRREPTQENPCSDQEQQQAGQVGSALAREDHRGDVQGPKRSAEHKESTITRVAHNGATPRRV